MFSLIGTLLFGLVIGFVAKLLMPGRDPGGWVVTILIGIAGSFIGSYLGQFLGLYSAGQPAGFLMSVIGAILLLWAHRMITSRA